MVKKKTDREIWQGIIDEVVASCQNIEETSGDEAYTEAVRRFEARIAGLSVEGSCRQMLMRVGMRTLVNERRAQARARLKARSMNDHDREKREEKRAKARAYAAVCAARRAEAAEYAKEHSIALDEVYEHRRKAEIAESAARVDRWLADLRSDFEAASKARAAEILSGWICEGGVPLALVPAADLRRLGDKEARTAEGHLRSSAFYVALADELDKVGVSCAQELSAARVVEIFDAEFSGREAPSAGAETRA